MSYESRDTSRDSGEPVEAFTFITTFGTFRYSTHPVEITIDDEVFQPMPGITRSAIEVSSNLASSVTVDISVLFNSDVAVACGYLSTPTEMTVEIWATHVGENDHEVIWVGTATGYVTSGLMLNIMTGNALQNSIAGPMASIIYQTMCNHVLYDARCKVDRPTFTTAAVVTAIGDAVIQVGDDGVANGELIAGEIINDRTGERRLIISNITNTLTISYDFDDILVGDTVSLSQGCLHNTDDCVNRFNNIANYGGFPFIPVGSD